MKYKYIIIIISILDVGFAVQPTTDFTTHTHLIKILNNNKEQLIRMSDMNKLIGKIGDILGAYKNNEAILTNTGISHINQEANIDFIRRKSENTLFPQKNSNNKLTLTEIDRVTRNRNTALLETSKSCFDLAKLKYSTDDVYKTLVGNYKSIMKASNIHHDLIVNNMNSIIIAKELLQIRQLLSKLLELQTVEILRGSEEWIKPIMRTPLVINKHYSRQ